MRDAFRPQRSSKKIVISSVLEFQTQLIQLNPGNSNLLYRGQPDSSWNVSCSAARRLTQNPAHPVESHLINHLLVGYLEILLAKAKMRQFLPAGFDTSSADLELLAQLQHQGAATGLIDFTRQPSVALWFACNEAFENDGAVYVLPLSATREIRSTNDLNRTIQSFYEECTLFSWEPSPLGNRIVAQSSFFVFGAPVIPRHTLTELVVQADSKRDILAQLETTFGINEEALVPDFPGYAVANATKKTFDVRRTVTYWTEQIELAKNDSQKSLAHFNCGVAYSAVKDFENAIDQFDQSTQIKEFSIAYNNRGFIKVELGQFKEAVIDFGKAIQVNPKSQLAYNNRGAAYTRLGLLREAISDLDKAILLNPEYADAYHNRGITRSMLDRNDKAIEDFSKVISLDLNYVEAYFRRGLVRLALDQLDEAVADFDKAITLYPDYGEAYDNRGVAKLALGHKGEAALDFEAALRIDPDYDSARQHLESLEAGDEE